MKCPNCFSENRDDSKFCSNCAAPLRPADSAGVSLTKTLATPHLPISKDALVAGKYRIIEELGRGGMGVVYKAEDIRLKRTVALKFLPPELTHIPEIRDRFKREARAAAALDHPNICTVYEFDQQEERSFISMAYIEGQSLKERIDSGPLELEEALKIATQIAEGLQAAHRKGIVHRDIKSGNIMIDSQGRAKIMDFGLARTKEGTMLTQDGSTMGTIAYMSPEQARGEKVDGRTDIWSLGVVLYEMFSGRLPFQGEHEQAVVYSILKEQPRPVHELRSEVPEPTSQLIARALEKDPDKRYQRIDDLLEDLNDIAAGIVPDEIRVRLMKAKLRGRRKAILYTGAAALAVLAAVLILTFFPGRAEAIDSIAVLPLENRTGDAGQEYYVDGVTEELIGHLAQISGLQRVISRTTMMRYKDTDKSLPEIARELKVGALVEGTVHQVGENVRLQLQVFAALPEERNLLAQTYERAGTDVLMMYGEIARAIAGRLQIKLTADEETRLTVARRVNPEAYEAYLRGQGHLGKMTPPDLETAQQYFELALKKDPDFALAYGGIAQVWIWRNQMGLVSPGVAVPEQTAAAQKAQELDNALPEVHYALGLIKAWGEWDWNAGEKAFQRSIELNPNFPDARVYYSHLLIVMNRPDDALLQMEKALKLDPFNVLFKCLYGAELLMLRRYDDAVEQCQSALRIVPNHWLALTVLYTAYYQQGKIDESMETIRAFYTMLGLGEGMEALTRIYQESGFTDAMNGLAEMLKEVARTVYCSPFMIAEAYVFAGNKDLALSWLEEAFEEHDPNMVYMGEMPHFVDLLGDEPRFQDLLRKMNLEGAVKGEEGGAL